MIEINSIIRSPRGYHHAKRIVGKTRFWQRHYKHKPPSIIGSHSSIIKLNYKLNTLFRWLLLFYLSFFIPETDSTSRFLHNNPEFLIFQIFLDNFYKLKESKGSLSRLKKNTDISLPPSDNFYFTTVGKYHSRNTGFSVSIHREDCDSKKQTVPENDRGWFGYMLLVVVWLIDSVGIVTLSLGRK